MGSDHFDALIADGDFDEKRSWFAHTCWFCGLKSKEVDFIVGDGVYQCWFTNRTECEARAAELPGEEWVKLPKPWHMQNWSKTRLLLHHEGRTIEEPGALSDAAKRLYGERERD
jgi:hypothetical protein